jgi:parallel beta-helix repeat protein
MSRRIALIVLAAELAVPQTAPAAPTCPDRTPAAIAAAASTSTKCQVAIARAGVEFLRTKLKVLGDCKLAGPAGACPTAGDTADIEKEAALGAKRIANACGEDVALAGLASAYSAETDPAVVSSCMLSQHNVVGDLVSARSNGATTEPFPATGKERADCVKAVSKAGRQFFIGAVKAAVNCLKAQTKLGTAGDIAGICVGSFAGGTWVPPTDPKTAREWDQLFRKTDRNLEKGCGDAEGLGQIESIFACPGAKTVADLQQCVECTGLDGVFDVTEQQFAERGTFVPNGPGAIGAAVGLASPGDKLLIGSGDYVEEVTVTKANLAIVGCGGATGDRPRVLPPTPEVRGNAFSANGVNGLLFQSLDFFNQRANHVFVAAANGVTMRDITGDGNRRTRYAVFPVRSNNVLIEGLRVVNHSDAPIYVGQSSTIVVRFNDVRQGVSAIEIENCGNAQVYGNFATGNTAGILVFKDPGLAVQLAECHAVHHNVFDDNNEPNFGEGTVAGVPTGTGILIISADTTPYSYNFARGNDTIGLFLTDQIIAEFGPPFSADESTDGNFIFNNVLLGNGASPDPERWPFPEGFDIGFLTALSSGNCESGNVFDTEIGFAGFATPPNAGTCVLPPPAVFPGCPAPPITTTTTTTGPGTTSTSTTVTTTTTTTTEPGSPSGAFLDGPSEAAGGHARGA